MTKPDKRRRSDRLMLNVPLRVEGKDAQGELFQCEALTINVNRHGASIQISRSLTNGQKITITNLINQRSGNFCVVGQLEAYPEGGGEWGVASTEGDPNLWGIIFPSPSDEPEQPKALLECDQCHTVELVYLSQIEIDVLDGGGLICKLCKTCNTATSWGYAVKQVALASSPTSAKEVSLDTPEPASLEAGARSNPRFAVQRLVTLRTASGQVEKVMSDNASKEGLCFRSETPYAPDQEVAVVWSHGGSHRRLETRGRIIRTQALGGSRQKIYSLRYESLPVLQPKPAGAGPGALYAGFWISIVLAAAALGAGSRSLASAFYSPFANHGPGLEAALLLVLLFLALQIWKRIQKREPEDEPASRKKHRVTVAFSVGLLAAVLTAGAAFGIDQGIHNTRFRVFLRDLTLEEVFETQIDKTAVERFSSPEKFQTACAQLKPLVTQWEGMLTQVEEDFMRLDTSGRSERAWKLRQFQKILDAEREKALLITHEISAAQELASLSEDQQQTFWTSKILPLHDQEMRLETRKREIAKEIAAR